MSRDESLEALTSWFYRITSDIVSDDFDEASERWKGAVRVHLSKWPNDETELKKLTESHV